MANPSTALHNDPVAFTLYNYLKTDHVSDADLDRGYYDLSPISRGQTPAFVGARDNVISREEVYEYLLARYDRYSPALARTAGVTLPFELPGPSQQTERQKAYVGKMRDIVNTAASGLKAAGVATSDPAYNALMARSIGIAVSPPGSDDAVSENELRRRGAGGLIAVLRQKGDALKKQGTVACQPALPLAQHIEASCAPNTASALYSGRQMLMMAGIPARHLLSHQAGSQGLNIELRVFDGRGRPTDMSSGAHSWRVGSPLAEMGSFYLIGAAATGSRGMASQDWYLKGLSTLLPDAPFTKGLRSNALKNEAVKLATNGQLDNAIVLLNQALQLNPGDPALYEFLAYAYFNKSDLDQSLKNARKRLSFGQAPVQLLALAGTLSFNAGDHFGARECLSEALRREPTNVQAREMLGRTYVALQRYADAVGEFSQVDPAAITKENIYAHYLFYGMSLLKIGRAADAEVQLRNALAIKPDSPDTLGMVYVSAHARGKAAEAAKIEARLVKMAQHDPRVYGTLAEAMDDSGAYQKAYQYFGKAYAALPSDALISRQLAASALRLKKYDEASSVSTAIIDAANVDTQILAYAYAIRGEVRWIRKENSDALADYEEAIKRNIPEWRAYSHAVSLIPHTDVANADKIEKYARIAIELNPKDEVAFNSLGASQYLKGRFADALANFKKAIELAPKFVHPHMNRSIIFWEQRKYGEAIAEVEKAIAKGLNTSDAHSKLGALYALTNRVNEASVQAKIAVQLDPKDHASRFLQFMTTIEKNNIAGNFADHGSTAYNKALEEAKGILKTWGAPGTMPAAYYDAQTIVALVSANYDTAAAYSRQSISINAANPAAYHRLAFALAQKRDFSAALAADRKALELAPNEPEIEKYASALEDILRSRQPIPPSSPPNGRRTVPQTTFILQDIGSFLKFPTYQNYLNLYRPLSPVYQMDVDRDRHGAEPFNGPRILNTTPIITIPML